MEQLCGGLEAGIEGGIHASRLLWQKHAQEEEWGILLIDAHNAFNGKNRTAMLWAVCHEFPSGAQFGFNCYCHLATLVIRSGDGTCHFLHRKEGVTQGDPLTMVVYGLGTPPSYRNYGQSTPVSLSHGMLVTLGQAEHSRIYEATSTT